MLFYSSSLNEDVLYFVENLKFLERKYLTNLKTITIKPPNLEILLKIQQVINDCTKLKSTDTCEHTLHNLFTFMLTKYSGIDSIVPSPVLSLHTILYLAINNHFEDFIQILGNFNGNFTKEILKELCGSLLEILENEKVYDVEFFQKTLLFVTKLIFNSKMNDSNKNDLISQLEMFTRLEEKNMNILEQRERPLSIVNTDKFFEKILSQIMNSLESKGNDHIEKSKIEYCINFIYYSSNRFSNKKTTYKNSSNILNLLSYISVEQKKMDFQRMNDFYSYLKQIVEENNGIKFTKYYVIMNKLVGYESLINNIINKTSYSDFNSEDLECLKSVPSILSDSHEIYSIFKRLNSSLTKMDLNQDLTSLFWTLFDKAEFEVKISVILKIYDDIEMTKEKIVTCLNNENMKKDSIICINQITYESIENPKALNTLARIFSVDLQMVVNKLMSNCLNNSSQMLTVVKVLKKFNKLLAIKFDLKMSVLIHTLKTKLDYIIINHNEKMFQNYLKILTEFLKDPTSFFYPDEFYDEILHSYFIKSSMMDCNNYAYLFEIFEIIYKKNAARLTNLAYFLQILNIVHFSNQQCNSRIHLKEKCLKIVDFTVKNIMMHPQTKNEVKWFQCFISQIYWPFANLVSSITKLYLFPSGFKKLHNIENFTRGYSVTYFNDDCLVNDLLELIAIDDNFLSLVKSLENIGFSELAREAIKVLSRNRTNNEFKRLFSAIWTIFNQNDYKLEFMDEILLHSDSKNVKKMQYIHNLTVTVEIYHSMNLNCKNDEFIKSLISFLKKFLSNDFDECELTDYLLYTIYIFEKLYYFVDRSVVDITSKFIIETLNRLLKIKEKKKKFSPKQQNIINLSSYNLLLLDSERFKSYKYLLSESFKKLLK